ncbi:MAG: hypothetical protein H6570_13580 [Lewinellaceae bacterium]|nr:hypothetical protein [Lewinellaceae bacterium]
MKNKWFCSGMLLLYFFPLSSGNILIDHQIETKSISFGNSTLQLTLEYGQQCVISQMILNGQQVLSGTAGIYSEVRTTTDTYSSRQLARDPIVKSGDHEIIIRNINYGRGKELIQENWHFTLSDTAIQFEIERNISQTMQVEEAAFPAFHFDRIDTWDGAFLSYGGLAWFYLFNQKLCTYGVHSNSSIFWNSKSGNGLQVQVADPGKQVAMKFSRSETDELVYHITVSDEEMASRYEKEKRSRFIRGKTDVWDNFQLTKGKSRETITLSYLNYHEKYDRGTLAGLDGLQVGNLLNTVARIGVIDRKLFGGNSWHTPYGPICLHEQYIAEFAIGINDESYIKGYQECLDFYRDHAIQPDGRVIARWAYLDEDAIPGSVNPWGFYEAQWGYLMDSNSDFVANVAQVYDLTGDLDWVARHKSGCEKALDYLLNRDNNGNHLVEMITDSQTERRGSDWIDIIWASYENAFVNAKLYYALTLWSKIEEQLQDHSQAMKYGRYAAAMKKSFNLTTEEGGFWDAHNRWYIHWREPDNSIHGDNLVVPVNLMAIAYGLCDDTLRSHAILNKIEEQTAHENLFFWPICIFPYAFGEGNDWQFPFPNYENGDLFLSWGSVGVQAYAGYQPDLALKYVQNVLDRYDQDGLAYQRYGRVHQDGLGDDILAGNSLALVGLYKSLYGVNPRYNRLYLNPHLPDKLSGTTLRYQFRGEPLEIHLNTGRYSVSNEQFKVTANQDFGFNAGKNEMVYFTGNAERPSIRIMTRSHLELEIQNWSADEYSWRQSSDGKNPVDYLLRVEQSNTNYVISVGDEVIHVKSDDLNTVNFSTQPDGPFKMIRVRAAK